LATFTKQKTAKIISILFIPQTFTIFVIPFLAFKYELLSSQRWAAIIIALTFGFILQIFTYFYIIKKKNIRSFDETNSAERTIPYLAQIILYVTGLFLLLYFDVTYLIIVFWFTYIVNCFVLVLINYKWKISSHSIGVAQNFALFVFLSNPVYWILIPIVLVISLARIELKVHDKYQIIGGLALGFILTYWQLYILL